MRGRVLATLVLAPAVGALLLLVLSEEVRTVALLLGRGSSVTRDPGGGARRVVLGTTPELVADFYPPRLRRGGDPPLLLLVHGSGVEGRRAVVYRLLAQQLSAEGFPVLAVDLRGFGESEKPSRPLSQHLRFGHDVAAAAAHAVAAGLAPPGRVVYVGHSLGASVVLHAAALHPRPAAVVALGTPPMRARLDEDGHAFVRERLEDMGHPTDPASMQAMEDELLLLDLEALRARGVPVPARFVFGEDEIAGRTLPDWGNPHDLVVIKDAGHRYGIQEGPWGLWFYDRGKLRALTAAIGEWAETWGLHRTRPRLD